MAFGFWKSDRPARASGKPAARRAGGTSAASTRYHAVSVQCGPACAATSVLLEGKRFLSSAAPVLPQPTCSRTNCQCRYVHHDDRRSGLDRREDDVWDGVLAATRPAERRMNRGRRASDHPERYDRSRY